MNEIRFDWDATKDAANQRKHRISFDEAQTVFYDEKAIQYFDPDHSESEDRYLMLGMSTRLRVLVVCHCFRESESAIRIISARRATKAEQTHYFRNRS